MKVCREHSKHEVGMDATLLPFFPKISDRLGSYILTRGGANKRKKGITTGQKRGQLALSAHEPYLGPFV